MILNTKFITHCLPTIDSFTIMLSILSDSQRAITETLILRLSTREALGYLKEHGFGMSESKFFRQKRKLENDKLKRLRHIAEIGFGRQHLERIDQLEIISKEMWKCYRDELDPWKKVQILLALAQVQPYLSQYYEATSIIVRKRFSGSQNPNLGTHN